MKIHYSLKSELQGGIIDISAPDELNIQVRNLVLKTAKGKKVERGGLIAERPSKFGGAYHAPCSGKVAVVDHHRMNIKCSDDEGTVEPVDVRSIEPGRELLRTIQELGIDIAPLAAAKNLVINGLNPEPGISVAEQLLRDELATLEAGLEMARKLIDPVRTVLAVAKGTSATLPGTDNVTIKPKYPNSLDALVVKAVTGREMPSDTRVVSVKYLYNLGRVALTGLPVMDTLITVNGQNYRVALGTPIRHIVSELGLAVNQHDKVVLGGPFQGETVYSLDEGVKKDDYGLLAVPHGTFPGVEDAACMNCGECVLNCPARVQANLISRYAEYEMFEQAEKHGLNSCFECGLCAFNCFARRPLLQYIRFAKDQIRAAKAQTSGAGS